MFRITQEICRQVFPVLLDLENPAFLAGLERLRRITERMAAAKAQGGVGGKLRKLGLTALAGANFARLFFLPAQANKLPAQVRLSPAF